MNFALFSAGDAYSTAGKIMGRQSAGKAMIRGVARRWPTETLHAFGYDRAGGEALLRQLGEDGFTGALRWRQGPGDDALETLGAVYYPAPITPDLAHARNARGPTSYSLFGVTHTLSSAGAMDQVAALILPPFKPWDALICTSNAAHTVVHRLQDELRDWFARETGASRFNPIQTPVIPLGVDAPAFARTPAQIASARAALGLSSGDTAFLFAGRLSFHAKANPSALYQGLQMAAGRTGPLVCIEAGVYPNSGMATAFESARAKLAPGVRFITVDGADEARYLQAWQAADVFASLSDNIQETFGLTPLEAMAAGQPVLVSDWNGYKDTVREGVDGYRIPVTLPMAGTGQDLALRHALGQDSYDFFIGRVSMSTAIDISSLADRIEALARDPALRARLGAAGAKRAREEFDWPVILDRYVKLVRALGDIRRAAGPLPPEPWTSRPDPFALFSDYPTRTLAPSSVISVKAGTAAVESLLVLEIARYVLRDPRLTPEAVLSVHRAIEIAGEMTVSGLQSAIPTMGRADAIRALMLLTKLDLVEVRL
ncbi:MAG: glycosyltransferase family 4 protein [Caulobacteraceae bacterium]|nr:glycosyltransferase family 4 protein [Caulobacteraceae bacterium]